MKDKKNKNYTKPRRGTLFWSFLNYFIYNSKKVRNFAPYEKTDILYTYNTSIHCIMQL